MFDISERDYAPAKTRPTLAGSGGMVPPLPPKPVKMGAGGDSVPPRVPVAPLPVNRTLELPTAKAVELGKPDPVIDAMIAALIESGDLRFDRTRGEYVSTAVRWRFPA